MHPSFGGYNTDVRHGTQKCAKIGDFFHDFILVNQHVDFLAEESPSPYAVTVCGFAGFLHDAIVNVTLSDCDR